MPRNGQGIYYYPPGTEGFPDTTIESPKYNAYIADVATDLNGPRPIVAGGTGATNAAAARLNLDAEVCNTRVANYDSHVFENGSFWSWTEAVGAPVANHGFSGTCVILNRSPDYIVLDVRDMFDGLTPGTRYVREKKGSTWGPWTVDGVAVAGAKPVNPPNNTLWWDNISGHLYVYYDDGNSKQWVVASPQADPRAFIRNTGDAMLGQLYLSLQPAGVNDATNKYYVDTTVNAGTAGKVNRAGDTMAGNLYVPDLTVTVPSAPADGIVRFGNTSTKYLYYNAGTFKFQGGPVNILDGGLTATSVASSSIINATGAVNAGGGINASGDITTYRNSNAAQGALYLGNSGQKYLFYDGANFVLNGGTTFSVTAGISAGGSVISAQGIFHGANPNSILSAQGGGIFLRPRGPTDGAAQAVMDSNGSWAMSNQVSLNLGDFLPPNGANGGFRCKDGVSNGITGNYFNILYASPSAYLYIDQTQVGILGTVSDYRIKKDVELLPSTWDAVKALRPVKYAVTDYTPEGKTVKLSVADDTERWGFVAHELQETLTESAATAKKDDPNALQAPNPLTVIAALTKALQEAMARIEALEAKAQV